MYNFSSNALQIWDERHGRTKT